MELYEYAELEKVMKVSLFESRDLTRDERIKKATGLGVEWCKSKELYVISTPGLYDKSGKAKHDLSGDQVIAYVMKSMASELLKREAIQEMDAFHYELAESMQRLVVELFKKKAEEKQCTLPELVDYMLKQRYISAEDGNHIIELANNL